MGGLLLLPSLLALGLSARESMPQSQAGPWDDLRGTQSELSESEPLHWAIAIGAGGESLELQPSRDLQEPDVLVYWSPGPPRDSISEDAILLGVLAGPEARRFALPEVARGLTQASILVYSLARAEVVASLQAPAPRGVR